MIDVIYTPLTTFPTHTTGYSIGPTVFLIVQCKHCLCNSYINNIIPKSLSLCFDTKLKL